MSANPEEIVQPIRDEFESLLSFVLSASPEGMPTAYEMECSLLRRLLVLGRLLLTLYLTQQAQKHQSATVLDRQGQELPYHSQRSRPYFSVTALRLGQAAFLAQLLL